MGLYLVTFILLVSSLIPLHFEIMLCMISITLNSNKLYFMGENMIYYGECLMCPSEFEFCSLDGVFYKYQLQTMIDFCVQVNYILLVFYKLDLSNTDRVILYSPTIIVTLLIFLCNSLSIHIFCHSLVRCKFKITSYWRNDICLIMQCPSLSLINMSVSTCALAIFSGSVQGNNILWFLADETYFCRIKFEDHFGLLWNPWLTLSFV